MGKQPSQAHLCREKPLKWTLAKEKRGGLGVGTHTHPPGFPLQTTRQRRSRSRCSGFSETLKAIAAH